MRFFGGWLPLPLTLLLAACGTPSDPASNEEGVTPPPVAATTVYVGLHCGPHQSGSAEVSWVDNADDYRALQRQIDAHAMENVDELAPVDFASQGVVLVEMGRRPTTGYSLRLSTPRVAIDSLGTATLEVRQIEPASGDVTAQMLTYPCLVAWLPRGAYHRLDVVDDEGERLGRVKVP